MPIILSQLIRLLLPDFETVQTKVHLAQSAGHEHPLDVWHEGHFEEWQAAQTQRNFSRPSVVSLIETHQRFVWLFAGIWRVEGSPVRGPHSYELRRGRDGGEFYIYELSQVDEVSDLVGRLHVRFEKIDRANYRLMETIDQQLVVSSLVEAPRNVPRFQGYKEVNIPFLTLQSISRQEREDWKTALSSVSAIYLITDQTDGRQYVGSASGGECQVFCVTGIWPMLPERSKDDDDFQGITGRTFEGLRAA